MENIQIDEPRGAYAGRWLSIAATVAITVLFSYAFFSFLMVGRHSAIQDILHGDNDAAAIKLFGVAFVYGGVMLLLSRINKRLGFYPVLGATVVLIGIAVLYGFPLAAVPAIAFALASFLMWKSRYHSARINKWLAVGALIPGVPVMLLIIARASLQLIYWSQDLA